MLVHSLGAKAPVVIFLIALGGLILVLGRPIGGNDQSTGWGLYRLDFLRVSLSLLACWGLMLLLVAGVGALSGVHQQSFTAVWHALLPQRTTLSLLGLTGLLVAFGGFNTYMQTNRPFRLAQTVMDQVVAAPDEARLAQLSTTVAAAVRQARSVHVAYALGNTDHEKLYLATLGQRDRDVVVILTVTPRDPLKLWNTYQLKKIVAVDEMQADENKD